jgi:hypothetical protein
VDSRPGDFIKRDYHDSIHLFPQRAFAAVMMHMPQRGWHDDVTAQLPNGKKPNIGTDHAAIVDLPKQDSSLAPGAGFRPFLEPVVACVNHWIDISDGDKEASTHCHSPAGTGRRGGPAGRRLLSVQTRFRGGTGPTGKCVASRHAAVTNKKRRTMEAKDGQFR